MSFSKQHIAVFLALLFHVSGFVGIVFTPYSNWFIQNTPLNLCLMSVLLVWTHEGKNSAYFFFLAIAFLTGMGTEMIGVNTGRLFGSYEYGDVLGPKINRVPWLIGLNWMVVMCCVAAVMQQLHDWMSRKMLEAGSSLPPRIKTLSLVVDGALLATLFDWLMEPVAVKLGYWRWKEAAIPDYNYLCWFLVSFALLLVMRWMRFPKMNSFAIQLLIIQSLFFLGLRIFLT